MHPEGIQAHVIRTYDPNFPKHDFMEHFRTDFVLVPSQLYEDIGPFKEDYPVLGDWEFNLRFLERHKIGLIPRELEYYHHGDTEHVESFGNSVILGLNQLTKQLPIICNAYVPRSSEGLVETAATSALKLAIDK